MVTPITRTTIIVTTIITDTTGISAQFFSAAIAVAASCQRQIASAASQCWQRRATRYSSGHTEGLRRTRRRFAIRLAERLGLLGKRTQLRLHEFSLNSNSVLKISGVAQLAYAVGVGGDISLGIGFHFFS